MEQVKMIEGEEEDGNLRVICSFSLIPALASCSLAPFGSGDCSPARLHRANKTSTWHLSKFNFQPHLNLTPLPPHWTSVHYLWFVFFCQLLLMSGVISHSREGREATQPKLKTASRFHLQWRWTRLGLLILARARLKGLTHYSHVPVGPSLVHADNKKTINLQITVHGLKHILFWTAQKFRKLSVTGGLTDLWAVFT